MLEAGLYIVATPIGHLDDITMRAVHILREVDVIAAEDTRTAQKLLRAHGLHKPLVSLHRDNEAQRTHNLLRRLEAGESVALISEAGTPCISDPGYLLVHALVEAGHKVTPVPGASAVIAALSASGLPSHHFVFLGFLPQRNGRRKRILKTYKHIPATLVLYEAPHRIVLLLEQLLEQLGDRQACIAREMTKIHEEFQRGTLSSLLSHQHQKEAILGEHVVLVQGWSVPDEDDQDEEGEGPVGLVIPAEDEEAGEAAMKAMALELLETGARPAKLARQLTSAFPSLSRRDAYRLLQTLKDESS